MLGSSATAVYLRAVADGEFRWDSAAEISDLGDADLKRCRDELVAHHLLTTAIDDPDRLLPVNPEIAAARLVEPAEEAIRGYRRSVDEARERLRQLLPVYLEHTASGSVDGGIEVIADPEDVQRLINRTLERASREMLTVQPVKRRSPAALASAMTRDPEAARRGIRMRMLYQHTTRTELSYRSYVSAMIEVGAEIRTTDQVADQMFIFDREIAFIPKRTKPDETPGAVVVREPVLVSFLCALFEQFWLSAVPFVPDGPGYQDASNDLQRSIVGLLAQGLKDEVVAKRLGMSVRTCRRHIASLMRELGAESRFEAGVKAAQLGLLGGEIPAQSS
jgi:DNA-binding CsgD family transcriptional regulator/sugar-specific transcriptional regulator TrmB